MNARRAFDRSRGFTLLELTLVLAAIGVLSLFASIAFSGADDIRVRKQSQAMLEVAREALRNFLLSNKRLPCFASDSRGFEQIPCPLGVEVGELPYATLGLAETRLVYGVYRAAGNDDIMLLKERTGDAENTPGYQNLADTIAALQAIPGALADPPVHLYSAALGPNGASDCSALTAGYYPAFILIAPNADKDGDGRTLDAPNTSAGTCFASPRQPMTINYDDVVVAESPSALAGWLTRYVN